VLSHVIGTRGSKASADDRELVIEHREALILMICEAAEMEHALTPTGKASMATRRRSPTTSAVGDSRGDEGL
jgi:hypothetical protein